MEKAITVTQLSTYIKQIFEAEEMLSFIKVIGEVSGLTIAKGVAFLHIILILKMVTKYMQQEAQGIM